MSNSAHNKSFIRGKPGPLTIGYIRDELRNNRYCGDTFEALWFMTQEYDKLWAELRRLKGFD